MELAPADVAPLRAHLDASPSPWHAVRTSAAALDDAGFTPLGERASWTDLPDAGYVTRGGALIAWRRPPAGGTWPLHVVGAHTDSPGLRIKPHPDGGRAGWRQLGVEIYGGVLLNSWLDRDLGIAGRLVLADGTDALVDVDEPIARVPQLAIHLDRDVNERGLVLDRHAHVTPVWATGMDTPFEEWIAARAGSDVPAWWELCLYDVQRAAVLGADRSLLASERLDNLVSC
jgi:aspartyl aminopeptidase